MRKLIPIVITLAMLAASLTGCENPGTQPDVAKESSTAAVKDSETAKETTEKAAGKDKEESKATPQPVEKAENKETLRFTIAGDILLGRGVGKRLESEKRGYVYPFEKTAEMLKKGDIVFGNLEESITDSTHCLAGITEKGGKYVLKNKSAAFEGIKYAGFNLINLANNHILDYYERGLYDTIELLDKNGIAHAGAGKNLEEARKPAIIEKKGLKIGMLSYTDMSEVVYKGQPPLSFIAGKTKSGVAPTNPQYIKEDIQKLRPNVDILIVSMHWGVEESFEIPDKQREFAHSIMDEGADMIIGHHPHQFQGIEMYKSKPIIYSLGNFIFDQNDPENQETFILDMEYGMDKKPVSFVAYPMRTINKSQVVPQSGQGAEAMLKREAELCSKLNTKCEVKDDRLVFEIK